MRSTVNQNVTPVRDLPLQIIWNSISSLNPFQNTIPKTPLWMTLIPVVCTFSPLLPFWSSNLRKNLKWTSSKCYTFVHSIHFVPVPCLISSTALRVSSSFSSSSSATVRRKILKIHTFWKFIPSKLNLVAPRKALNCGMILSLYLAVFLVIVLLWRDTRKPALYPPGEWTCANERRRRQDESHV